MKYYLLINIATNMCMQYTVDKSIFNVKSGVAYFQIVS